jgi:hypothetical protein
MKVTEPFQFSFRSDNLKGHFATQERKDILDAISSHCHSTCKQMLGVFQQETATIKKCLACVYTPLKSDMFYSVNLIFCL